MSPKIVVIGAGFAGLSAVKALAHVDAEIILIDKSNHHLFQPLLYQVATAALSPAQIAQPIRSILRKQKNCKVILGEVLRIDCDAKIVYGHHGQIEYDYLIVAAGCRDGYFGHENWRVHAPGLKNLADATAIRTKILSAFEAAEIARDEKERAELMTFVIIGGGPTGVEVAGAIAELARITMRNDFRNINPDNTKIIIIESGSRVLASFPEKLSAYAQKSLHDLGVTIRTGNPVTDCNEQGVQVGGEWIKARTILWAAGVRAAELINQLPGEKDRQGRIKVTRELQLPNHPNVFVVGDAACALAPNGQPFPGLAPVAKQQGRYVAQVIEQQLKNTETLSPFKYSDSGSMATIGRARAVANLNWLSMKGALAWCLWGAVHLIPLVGFRNRFVVACDWVWSYLTFERGVRLISQVSDRQADL